MRIFFAGVMHESSLASPIPTTLASFEGQSWRPQDSEEPPDHVDTCAYGPAWRLAGERGHDRVGARYAMAQPSAPLQSHAWAALKRDYLRALEAALPVDAVFLMLHGAQAAMDEPDCEGDFLEAVRAVVGPRIPIGAVLDLHANLTPRMLAKATLIIACKEYPHTDYAERGAEMLDLLEAAHLGRIRPVMAAARAPVLGLYPTTVEPMAEFVRDLTAAEKPPILSLSALHGFFDADHAYAGASVIAIADGDPAAAEAEAARQAARFIALAGSQKPLGLPLAEALEEARRRQGLVILADIADNPGGGAAGDDTLMLEALIREFHEPAAIGMIFDPVAVAFARDAGVGGELDLRIGGKIGPRSGQPVDLRVRIMALGEDARQAAFGVGPPRLPLGRTATVRWRSLDIVLTDLRQQVFSRHCFTDNGVDLLSKRLVAVKSTQHFHRDFSAIADHVIWCDPRGELLPSASYNPYRHIRRPIFPVDPLSAVSVSDLDGRPL